MLEEVCTSCMSCCEAGQWMTRDSCGPWQWWQIDLYKGSAGVIGLSYLFLGGSLLFLLTRTKLRFVSKQNTMMWGLFVFICGLGHIFEDIGAFYWGRYDVYLWIHVVTAIVSVYTACTFPITIFRIMKETKGPIVVKN